MMGFLCTAHFNRPEKRRDHRREKKPQVYIANDSSLKFAYKPETGRQGQII